eukprot:gene17365-biopygen2124
MSSPRPSPGEACPSAAGLTYSGTAEQFVGPRACGKTGGFRAGRWRPAVFPASPGRPCWAVRGIPCGMSGILWAVLGIPLASVGDPLRSARDPLGCFGNPPPRESPRRSPRESPWDRLAGWRFGGNRRGPMVQGDGATPNCPNGEGP